MVDILLRPGEGDFVRPFGCGQFIRAYLAGEGPAACAITDRNRPQENSSKKGVLIGGTDVLPFQSYIWPCLIKA